MPVSNVPSPRSSGFAFVARRISGWTTNLLATGIIAVLALVVGKQLIAWWRVEPGSEPRPPIAASVPLAGLGSGNEPLELGFGQLPYQIQRRTVRGDRQAASDALVAACRSLAEGRPPLPNLGPAESRLLAMTARQSPLAEGPGGLQVFASPDAVPLVVATIPTAPPTRDNPVAASPPQPQGSQAVAPPAPPAGQVAAQLGAEERRVVVWGMAAPAAEDAWNLYVAHADRDYQGTTPSQLSAASGATTAPGEPVTWDSLPLPPDSRRTLAVRDSHGSLSAFAGSGRAEDWVAFFTAWFQRPSWIVLEDWQPSGGCWHARYQRAEASSRATIDVQIGSDGGSGLFGFISVAGAVSSAGK